MYSGKCLSPERSGIIGKSRDYNDYCCLWNTCILFHPSIHPESKYFGAEKSWYRNVYGYLEVWYRIGLMLKRLGPYRVPFYYLFPIYGYPKFIFGHPKINFWISIIHFWISKNRFMDILKYIFGYPKNSWLLDIHSSIFGYPKMNNGYPKIHPDFWISINQFLDIQKAVEYWISIIRFMDIQTWIMNIRKYTPIIGYP